MTYRKKDKEEKIKAIDELIADSVVYNRTEKYLELLNFISKFPKLSTFNAALIKIQNPGVKIVLSAGQWKVYNREVIEEARPLVILMPFSPIRFVFDIADTLGKDELPKELTNPLETLGDFDLNILKMTIKNCNEENIRIIDAVLNNISSGYAKSKNDNFSITLNKTLGINERYSTLIHELGHIFAGHLGSRENDWWRDRSNVTDEIAEIEAESISYLVCKRVGLKTSSEKYLHDYVKKNKTLPKFSADTVLRVVDYIEKMGSDKFIPKKKKR